MKYYYAIFKESKEAIEVEFPDLQGCVTFGKDWDEAYLNAIDVLAAWLANAEAQFINEPSPHSAFKKEDKHHLVPIPLNEKTLLEYEKLKRINIILPVNTLSKVDAYRKSIGLKRSTVLAKAIEEYVRKYANFDKRDENQIIPNKKNLKNSESQFPNHNGIS